jgi:hypothetical protein
MRIGHLLVAPASVEDPAKPFRLRMQMLIPGLGQCLLNSLLRGHSWLRSLRLGYWILIRSRRLGCSGESGIWPHAEHGRRTRHIRHETRTRIDFKRRLTCVSGGKLEKIHFFLREAMKAGALIQLVELVQNVTAQGECFIVTVKPGTDGEHTPYRNIGGDQDE